MDKWYIKEEFRDESYHFRRDNTEEGHLITENGEKVYGIKCYGAPIGSIAYIKEFLRLKGNKIAKLIETTGDVMDPMKIMKPEVPGRQCLWQMLLRSLHVPCTQTDDFSQTVDGAINKLIGSTLELNMEELLDTTMERIRLPVRFKGLGMRSLRDRRHTEFIGGITQGIPPLINCASNPGLIRA